MWDLSGDDPVGAAAEDLADRRARVAAPDAKRYPPAPSAPSPPSPSPDRADRLARISVPQVATAIAFFCLMEALQAVQQFSSVLAADLSDPNCRLAWNQFLTVLGYVHIMFQPYFTNKYFEAFRPAMGKAWAHEAVAWKVVFRMCLAYAALGLLRLALMPAYNADELEDGHRTYLNVSGDWLEGEQLCTYRGAVHLAWAFPLPKASYLLGGMGTHSFLMFVPVLCIGGLRELDACSFLLLTGPVLGMAIAPRLEQASVWCFFSIAQLLIGLTSSVLQVSSKGGAQRANKAK